MNGRNYSIIRDSLSGGNIGECPSDPCALSPCMNGGTCTSNGNGRMFSCQCRFGFGGGICSNGKCTFSELSLFYPIYVVTVIDVVYFTGDSYISYPSLNESFGNTRLYLEVKPNASDGLILYNGQTNGMDYISLSLLSGYVQFQYNLGSGAALLESIYQLDLNDWHTIEARRNGQSGVLTVDGVTTTGTSPGTETLLQLGGPLFIGGVENFTMVNANNSEVGYAGCIRQLRTNLELVDFIADSSASLNIKQCPSTDPCISQPCMNGGTCVYDRNERLSCLCTDQYTGAQCEELLCSENLCQNGGRCTVETIDDTLIQSCQCILPFAGEICTEG